MAGEMDGKYVVRGSQAECYVTIDGNRYNFAQAISLEATMDISKSSATAIGKTGKFNFGTTWEGSGTMTLHYNQSIMREIMYKFKELGTEVYFTIEVTNKSNDGIIGEQTIMLNNCSINGGTLTKFDSDSDYLDEDVEFTFDDWEMPKKFNQLPFMSA